MAVLAVIKHNVLAFAVDDEGSFLAVENFDSVLVSDSRSAVSGIFVVGFFIKSDNTLLVVLNHPFFLDEIFVHSCGFDDFLGRSFNNWFGLLLDLSFFFGGGLSGSSTGSGFALGSKKFSSASSFLSGPHPDVTFTSLEEIVDSFASVL